jgi:hypothetical protein
VTWGSGKMQKKKKDWKEIYQNVMVLASGGMVMDT